MATYIAVHHVALPGGPALPGEVLRAEDVEKLDAAHVERLLKLGAIREVTPEAAVDQGFSGMDAIARDIANGECAAPEAIDGAPDGTAAPEDEGTEPEDGYGEEPEVIEIDAMEGLVTPKAKKPAARKPRAKKAAGGE